MNADEWSGQEQAEDQGKHPQPAPSMEADYGTDLARHLADIATVMLRPGRATSAAQRILILAVATIDDCDEAALCGDGGLNTHT